MSIIPGFIDDAFGKKGIVKTVTDVVADSGIPGSSHVAGLGSKILWGQGDDPSAPDYNPYKFNKSAFETSEGFNQDTNYLRDHMRSLGGRDYGTEHEGLFGEGLAEQRAAMLGQRPSIAEMQMQSQVAANNAQQMSAAGSARGAGATMLAQMNASQSIANANQDANYQGAMLRAQEQDMARKGLFGAISQDRDSRMQGANVKFGNMNRLASSLSEREGVRMGGLMGLEDRNAGQHTAVQGRQLDNYTNEQSAQAYRDNAEQASNDRNMQTGASVFGALAKR
jgi:hypothetical protein